MPEWLKELASKWYCSNKEVWETWEDVKASFYAFFIPSRMYLELENDEVLLHDHDPNSHATGIWHVGKKKTKPNLCKPRL